MSTIRRNIFSSLIGNIVYALGQYLILILFIKYFTKAEVGEYLFALAFVTPINLGFDMQLRTLYVTESNPTVSFPDYHFYRLVTNAVGLIVILIAILIYNPVYFYMVFVISATKALETHLELLYGVYQSKYRLDFVAKSKIIRTVFGVISVGLTVLLTSSLTTALWVYLFVWIILLLLYERKNVVKLGFLKPTDFTIKLDRRNFKYLIINSSPLIFAILVDKYYANFPRLAIEKVLGLEELAIFGSLLYFKSLAAQIISAIGQSTAPNLRAFYQAGAFSKFRKLVFGLILSGFFVGFVGVVIVYLIGDVLLELIYSSDFVTYTKVLTYILLGASISFSYIFIGTAITCMRKQWVKLPISVIGLLTIFLLFLAFTPTDLLEIAMIILYTEVLLFILYFGVYFYFLKHVINKSNKETLSGLPN